MSRRPRTLRAAAVAVVAAAAFALAACSSPAAGSGSSPSASGDAGAALSSKSYTVAVQSAWPPIGFLDGDDLKGVAIDVAGEFSKRLGITFSFEKPAFADMIPGVQSSKYDFALWGADITADRMKIVDQLSWISAGYYVEAPAGSSISAGTDLQGLCGLTVALVKGQTTQGDLEKASAACTADGKKEITLSTFPDQPSSELAVKSGRADVATVGSQTFGYISTTTPGQWDKVSDLIHPVLSGMVFRKGDPDAAVFAATLNDMIADGTYAKILKKWNVSDSAIEKAEIDPAL